MTIKELYRLMMKHNISLSQLNALSDNHFDVLEKMPAGVFNGFIENGVNAEGYHDGGVGENPLGLDCGECSRNCCIGCDVWNKLTILCSIFGIKYKEGTYPDMEKYILVPRYGLLDRAEFVKKYGGEVAKRIDNNCMTKEDLNIFYGSSKRKEG